LTQTLSEQMTAAAHNTFMATCTTVIEQQNY